MKNRLTLFLLMFFCLSSAVFSQNEFYDALALGKFKWKFDPDENKYVFIDTGKVNITDLVNIINKYFPGDNTYNQLNAALSKNPYIKLKEDLTLSVRLGDMNLSEKLENTLTSISGLNVTNFAYGMSDFLIERTKEELTIAFFQRFEKFLEKYPESAVLFPQTSDFMTNMLAYEYTIWISTLREKFLEDLQDIPFKFDDVLELPKYEYVRKEFPEILICLQVIETIQKATADIQNQKHPADVINEISTMKSWNEIKRQDTKNILALFKTTDIISRSLRFYDTSMTLSVRRQDTIFQNSNCLVKKVKRNNAFKYDTLEVWDENSIAWVTPQHLKILLEDTITFRIYMGLLYQEALLANVRFFPYKRSVFLTDNIILKKGDIIYKNDSTLKLQNDTVIQKGNFITYKKDSISLDSFLYLYKDNITGMRDLIETFNSVTANVDKIQNRINYKRNNKTKLSRDDYKEYLTASLNTINFGFDIMEYLDSANIDGLKQYRSLSNELEKTILNTYGNHYAEAMLNASDVLETVMEILETNNKEKLDSINRIKKTDIEKNLISDYDEAKKKYKESSGSNRPKKDIEKQYGLTKKSFSLKQPIKDFGKYTQKAFYYGSFMARMVEADSSEEVIQIIQSTALPAGSSSLKKYNTQNIAVNAYLGPGIEFPVSGDQKTSFNLFAPVGVSWTPFSLKKYGSVSIFTGLIDLGAIVNYRLTDKDTVYTATDTLTTSNKIVLGNIFSPSINIVYGFGGNIPLALSAGFQYTPGLAKVTGSELITRDPYWIFNVTLTVDLPLYNLNSGNCKRKK